MTTTQETPRVMSDETRTLLESVAEMARETGEFSSVAIDEEGLAARFIDEDVDAAFRVDPAPGGGGSGLEVSMKTPDRWLSQSVEATLVNSGDALEDLIDEELHLRGKRVQSVQRASVLRVGLEGGLVLVGGSESIALPPGQIAQECAYLRGGDRRGVRVPGRIDRSGAQV